MANQTRAWPKLEDQNRRDHADERAEQDGEADVVEAVSAGEERDSLERVDYGCAVAGDCLPLDDAGEDHGDADVEDGADDERGDDADGDVAAAGSCTPRWRWRRSRSRCR